MYQMGEATRPAEPTFSIPTLLMRESYRETPSYTTKQVFFVLADVLPVKIAISMLQSDVIKFQV